jgi:hypothetical protein
MPPTSATDRREPEESCGARSSAPPSGVARRRRRSRVGQGSRDDCRLRVGQVEHALRPPRSARGPQSSDPSLRSWVTLAQRVSDAAPSSSTPGRVQFRAHRAPQSSQRGPVRDLPSDLHDARRRRRSSNSRPSCGATCGITPVPRGPASLPLGRRRPPAGRGR